MTREEELHAYIASARWFGGKDRAFEIGDVLDADLAQGVTTTLVDIVFDTGSTDRYQVPMSSYTEPAEHLEHALIGTWDGRWHYDAVHDHDAMATWLAAFAADGADSADTAFNVVAGHDLDTTAHSALFSGEQSNSSVAFGEDSLMKLFRRVSPGANPDIEVHKVLTEAGSEHVAHLYGWAEIADATGEPIQLAMLQQFLRTATEGWAFALTSVRNLFAEADLHPEEVGGDFAGEAHRLGAAVADVHALLREHFPTTPLDPAGTVAAMQQRLQDTIAIVPELEAVADTARSAFDRVSVAEGALAQRVHGDLHLGQTLRTSLGWKLVDFEGEPARPLADRMLPDSPWRDVAGMLRSFDYAARSVQRDFDVDEEAGSQLEYRGTEWVQRNRDAFLEGYAEVSGSLSHTDLALIEAYELDKAVYEVAYEARNRPTWIDIPLAALARTREEI
jgi:maltokinase